MKKIFILKKKRITYMQQDKKFNKNDEIEGMSSIIFV